MVLTEHIMLLLTLTKIFHRFNTSNRSSHFMIRLTFVRRTDTRFHFLLVNDDNREKVIREKL